MFSSVLSAIRRLATSSTAAELVEVKTAIWLRPFCAPAPVIKPLIPNEPNIGFDTVENIGPEFHRCRVASEVQHQPKSTDGQMEWNRCLNNSFPMFIDNNVVKTTHDRKSTIALLFLTTATRISGTTFRFTVEYYWPITVHATCPDFISVGPRGMYSAVHFDAIYTP